MKKWIALLLVLTMIPALAACGSKDAVAGTWSADMGLDGIVTWTFNGKGSCTMDNTVMKQKGTYSLDGDQMTVKLENWDDAKVYTFSVSADGNSLTMNDNEGLAVSGTYTRK